MFCPKRTAFCDLWPLSPQSKTVRFKSPKNDRSYSDVTFAIILNTSSAWWQWRSSGRAGANKPMRGRGSWNYLKRSEIKCLPLLDRRFNLVRFPNSQEGLPLPDGRFNSAFFFSPSKEFSSATCLSLFWL